MTAMKEAINAYTILVGNLIRKNTGIGECIRMVFKAAR
jgi:hypothetical protein